MTETFFGTVNMEEALDFMVALEKLGLDQETISDILNDFEAAQKNGTYPAKNFIEDILNLYHLEDGKLSAPFRHIINSVKPHPSP